MSEAEPDRIERMAVERIEPARLPKPGEPLPEDWDEPDTDVLPTEEDPDTKGGEGGTGNFGGGNQ